jgi:alpha-beta hydrolase superfamily lysophospholipase
VGHRVLIGAAGLVVVALLAALIVIVVVAVRARAERQANAEELHPFYVPPDPLPPAPPGDLIRAEPIEAPGVRMWRVLYHSTTETGHDIAVSGLIAVPDEAPPAGGFPVVAVAHGTDGMARICAPSLRPLASRSVLPTVLTPPKDRVSFFEQMVQPFTDAGYAVVATDYQGLGTPGVNPYLVGVDAARNVLDAARLIQRFPMVQVAEALFIWGISQGGQAALFAGQIAPTYAPELRLLGVVAGAPAAELELMAGEVAGISGRSVLTGLLVMIARAWSAVYPDLDAGSVLTPQGLRRMTVVEERCIDDVLLTFAFREASDVVIRRGMNTPAWQAAIARNTPGMQRTTVPLRIFQGGADWLIRPAFTETLVQRLCAVGDTVAVQVYPGLGHLSVSTPSMPDTLIWMADRLAQATPPSSC